MVVVRVTHGGTTGVGAAAPSRHYGETADTVAAVLPDLTPAVEAADDPLALGRIERRLADAVRENPAAKAAVSIAVHDLATKTLGVPLYRLWGLDSDRTVASSYTIGIADPDEMVERAERAVDAGYPVLKVKLDADHGPEIVERIREAAPGVRIRVDANEAWRPHRAVRACEALADLDVEFVEQPVPAENPGGLARVHANSPVPIAVDESCRTLPDVPAVADRADVTVLKLMKCGGLREAVRMIHAAHAHDLEVMLGCMVEPGAAIAAAAHLTPMVEYADLDGALLLAEDPFASPVREGGAIELDDSPGTGAETG